MEKRLLPTALYCRLSREDGDRMESDSIGNQRKLLEAYIENHPELVMAECYADDGYTGTNFQRPAFQRMLRDIGNGRIRCVLVRTCPVSAVITSKQAAIWSVGCRSTACGSSLSRTISTATAAPTT